MSRLYLRLACALALMLASALGRAADAGYQVFDLGALDGTTTSSALGINNHGQVVGQAYVDALTPFAFIWSEGTGMQGLNGSLPDSTRSIAYGINDAGTVVGEVRRPVLGFSAFAFNTVTQDQVQYGRIQDGNRSDARAVNSSGVVAGRSNYLVDMGANGTAFPFRAMSWSPGSDPVKLNPLVENNGSSVSGRGINESGVIVGQSSDPNNLARGVAWLSPNQLVELLPYVGPGQSDTGSSANGINDAGLIVGTTTGTASGRAAVWRLPDAPGAATLAAQLLGHSDPNANDVALDINNAGDAVGYADQRNSFLRAVLWNEDGSAVDLTAAGTNAGSSIFVNSTGKRITLADAGFSRLSVANALNDAGWIVGQGVTGDGGLHAFLLKPTGAIPEPRTWMLLLAGLAGMDWLRRASLHRS